MQKFMNDLKRNATVTSSLLTKPLIIQFIPVGNSCDRFYLNGINLWKMWENFFSAVK